MIEEKGRVRERERERERERDLLEDNTNKCVAWSVHEKLDLNKSPEFLETYFQNLFF